MKTVGPRFDSLGPKLLKEDIMSLNHPNCPECGYGMDRVLPGVYECYSCKNDKELPLTYKRAQSEYNKLCSIAAENVGLNSLGSSKTEYQYDTADPNLLERFKNPFEVQAMSNGMTTTTTGIVSLNCFEFTSLCPITGQPDWGTIEIEYRPDQWCVESKALKLYLMSYRQHGAFHESCVNKICCDLFNFIQPHYIKVKGNFNGRGGISINPVCHICKEA